MMHQFVLGYFDPGSGSILLQVLVGGFAGVMLFFRYAWQGVRQKFLGSRVESDHSPNASRISEEQALRLSGEMSIHRLSGDINIR